MVIVSLTTHVQKEAISPTEAVEKNAAVSTTTGPSRCDLKSPKFRKFSGASRGWAPTLQPLHRHTRLPCWNNPCYYRNPPEAEPPFQKS